MAISSKKIKNSVFHALTVNFQSGLVNGTLENTKGNVSKAARKLGITRATIYSIIRSKEPILRFSDIKPLERRMTDDFVPRIEE